MFSGYEWLFPIQKYIRLKKCPDWSEAVRPQWLSFIILMTLLVHRFAWPYFLDWYYDCSKGYSKYTALTVGGSFFLIDGMLILLKVLLVLAVVHVVLVVVEACLAMVCARPDLGTGRPYHAAMAFRFALAGWPFWCWYFIALVMLPALLLDTPPAMSYEAEETARGVLLLAFKVVLLVGMLLTAQQAARAMVVCLEAEADEPAGPADVISQ